MAKWIDIESLNYKELRFLSAADLEKAIKEQGKGMVHCKDCKYNPDHKKTHTACVWDPEKPHYPGDFCSRGVHK